MYKCTYTHIDTQRQRKRQKRHYLLHIRTNNDYRIVEIHVLCRGNIWPILFFAQCTMFNFLNLKKLNKEYQNPLNSRRSTVGCVLYNIKFNYILYPAFAVSNKNWWNGFKSKLLWIFFNCFETNTEIRLIFVDFREKWHHCHLHPSNGSVKSLAWFTGNIPSHLLMVIKYRRLGWY